MRYLIFANGDIENYADVLAYVNADGQKKIIACDGGLRHTHAISVCPNIILGDLDSAPPELLQIYANVPRKKFPARKDETDLELAVDFALDNGAGEIFIFGGASASRLDHTLANVQILYRALKRNVRAEIIGSHGRIFLASGETVLRAKAGSLISLLPFAGEPNITTRGLEYPLCAEKLLPGTARGVSNVFVEDEAELNVEDGAVIVILPKWGNGATSQSSAG